MPPKPIVRLPGQPKASSSQQATWNPQAGQFIPPPAVPAQAQNAPSQQSEQPAFYWQFLEVDRHAAAVAQAASASGSSRPHASMTYQGQTYQQLPANLLGRNDMPDDTTVKIEGLPTWITDHDLLSKFREIGRVVSWHLRPDELAASGFAKVCYSTIADAQTAVHRFNNAPFSRRPDWRDVPLHVWIRDEDAPNRRAQPYQPY